MVRVKDELASVVVELLPDGLQGLVELQILGSLVYHDPLRLDQLE